MASFTPKSFRFSASAHWLFEVWRAIEDSVKWIALAHLANNKNQSYVILACSLLLWSHDPRTDIFCYLLGVSKLLHFLLLTASYLIIPHQSSHKNSKKSPHHLKKSHHHYSAPWLHFTLLTSSYLITSHTKTKKNYPWSCYHHNATCTF